MDLHDEVQEIYHNGDSGSFELVFEGQKTATLPYDATASHSCRCPE